MYNNQEGETRPCYQARGLVKLKKIQKFYGYGLRVKTVLPG